MNKRVVGSVLLLLALGVMIYWVANGAYIWTLTQVQVPVTDELFGTTSMEWKDEFRPGLLPVLGPVAGVLLVAAIFFFVKAEKPKKIGSAA